MRRWSLSLLFVLVSTVLCASARANGRFPNAEQLREIAPGSLVVSGTYGLLVSGNSKDFQFVCESTLFGKTLMGSWVDPLLEVLPDGTILSGSLNGLRLSRDHGCSFQSDWSLPHDPAFIAPDPSASGATGTIVDLCPADDTSQGMIALASLTSSDGSTLEHRLYRSTDGARTWAELGLPIPTAQVRVVLTVDVAPSDPNRIYVSGSSLGKSVLVVSEDAGATWVVHTIALDDEAGIAGLYIAAVSPSDPKRVYLRVSRRSLADDGSTTWDDSLLVSDDAGSSTRQVLRQSAALLGFALSPDGSTVLAGYGDPVVAPVVVSDTAIGLYAATSDALDFSQKVADFSVSCLRWAAGGLYACAKESDPLGSNPALNDFHVGVFKGSGVPEKLADFTPLVKLKDLRGPLPLASGAPSACQAEWAEGDPSSPGQASVCASLNACAKSGVSVALSAGSFVCGAPQGAGGADSGVGGSAPNQSATAGDAPSGGSSVAAGGSKEPAPQGSPSHSCRLDGRQQRSAPWLMAFLVLAAALTSRRTRG
ncbi:MAG: hypothetical protein ABW061_22955 [Polyangiaceae bacterium]